MRKLFLHNAHATLKGILGFCLLAMLAGCQEGENFLDEVRDKDKGMDGKEMVRLFASTNTGGNFTVLDVSDLTDVPSVMYNTTSPDADGIYYDNARKMVYQLSRTSSQVNAYTSESNFTKAGDAMLAFSSTSDFTNGREIAVSGNKLVVAEDVDSANQLVVYSIIDDGFQYEKTYMVPFDVWGIHLDGNTLYAVVDKTNKLAVFHDFFSHEAGAVAADMMVGIEGVGRTHGLSYDAEHDTMFLTDIEDADNDADGAFHIITDFTAKAMKAGDGGTIALKDHRCVMGEKSMLGNPVDIAFDYNNQKIYIAERAKDGGMILAFDYPMSGGDAAPVFSLAYPGASAVYLAPRK